MSSPFNLACAETSVTMPAVVPCAAASSPAFNTLVDVPNLPILLTRPKPLPTAPPTPPIITKEPIEAAVSAVHLKNFKPPLTPSQSFALCADFLAKYKSAASR